MPAPQHSEETYFAVAEHLVKEIEDVFGETDGFTNPLCELYKVKVRKNGADCKYDIQVGFNPNHFYPGVWSNTTRFDDDPFQDAITPTHTVLVEITSSLRLPLEKYTENRFTMSVNPSWLKYHQVPESDMGIISGPLLVTITSL